MAEQRQQRIGFKLAQIDTDQFALLEEDFISKKEVTLNVGVKFSVNPSDKGVGVHFLIKFQQGETVFIILETACYFAIETENWGSFSTENNKITFPQGFAMHLAVLTVGTARGILYEKIKESKVNQFMLPTIDVTNLVKEDVTLDLDEVEEKE